MKTIYKEEYPKIIELYIKYKKSLSEICKVYNVKSEATIYNILKKKGINLRSLSEAMKLSLKNRNVWNKDIKIKDNKEIYDRMYSRDRNKKISEMWKGKSWEERFGEDKAKEMKKILSKSYKGKHHSTNTEFKKGKPSWNKNLKGVMPEPKNKGKLSGKVINCSNCGKEKYFEQSKLKHKNHFCSDKCQQAFQIGKNHPMFGKNHSEEALKKISAKGQGISLSEWKKYISFEPYTSNFNKEFKLMIKQREGFMCIKCGMREEDSKIIFNKGLSSHHINYDKKLTIPENCCALCIRCHVETNANRPSWTKFFQSLLTERYGYSYSENLEPILIL